ncbi:MAG TPA: carbonic anhydrase [Acidobacteriaceae bacterium]|nr:carbonic anhydrase [Acidobacteriaceae bacterium]
MKRIVDGVLKFQRDVYPNQKALFQQLSDVQRPQAMFIGCSDSRVIPELFTQQDPGALFVVRNAGNIVPPYGVAPGGVSASIEYAVAVLGVPDIVICGHSGCGAMTAILRGSEQLEALPEVARWLHFADAARSIVADHHALADDTERLNLLIRENVLAQLGNLLTHPTVAAAIKRKEVRLHGWVYDIATARVTTYDAENGQFIPLAQANFQGVTS